MDPHPISAADATGSSVATKVMEVGGVGTAAGWFTGNNIIALIGLTVTIAGFIVNFYFQHRRDKRESEFQIEKLAAIRREKLFTKPTDE